LYRAAARGNPASHLRAHPVPAPGQATHASALTGHRARSILKLMRDKSSVRALRVPALRASHVSGSGGADWVRPIVTLTTDFGLADSYVAAMKAVLIARCPQTRLIDVTHGIPAQDILCGSITLERAVDGFPERTVHLAVVDPGVGTDRRLIVAQVKGQLIVCPDNGLITWTARLHGQPSVHEITWRAEKTSATFHGRDVLAPVAGMLACGEPLDRLARPIDDPILLDLAPAESARGRVIHIDHFGNATTNIRQNTLGEHCGTSVRINRRRIGKLKRTYWDVAPGKPLALIGSSGLLEIAVRDGSARDDLKLRVGDDVVLDE
jgi:S-adenosylmethionine hydrolase